jgi:hypothetical protein
MEKGKLPPLVHNWTSVVVFVLTVVFSLIILFLLFLLGINLIAGIKSPYIGILLYMILSPFVPDAKTGYPEKQEEYLIYQETPDIS